MIKLADTLAPMADFPAVEAKYVAFNDNKSLQEKYDNGELGGGTGGSGEENTIESVSVNGVNVSVDENKNVDITVPSIEGLTKDADLATVAKSGDYEDLINKPIIPDITGLATKTYVTEQISNIPSVDLTDYAKKSEIPDVSGYITEEQLLAKDYADKAYVTEEISKASIGSEIDLSSYLSKVEATETYVAKESGKSLIADTEIERLASVYNYDDTQVNSDIAALSNRVKSVEDEVPNLATKTYVGEQIVNSEHLKREIVTVLPSDEEASDNIIYMLKVENTVGDDKYQEYMKIDGTVQMVGDTSVDLTDYAKAVDIPTTVSELTDSADYAKKTDLHSHTNKTVLDKFTESSEGILLFDGKKIEGDFKGESAYEIAVNNGFVGTEQEWLKSLKGKDGKYIDLMSKDDNNNIIVTYTDGTTQNIGQLNFDVQADFLAEEGFGNLRYYNGVFQYYNSSTSTWIDTILTSDNVFFMYISPQPMKKMIALYDVELCKYKLKFEEPNDTIIDNQLLCTVKKIIIRRKLGEVPNNETDGDLVCEIDRDDFGSYTNKYYVDENCSPNVGDVYYYKAFPMSTTGFYNYSKDNETEGIVCKDYVLYGFKLDQNESDPASMITYLSDCDNKYYESAYMNYASDVFNYGDWKDAWFIKNLKPCMLKYDGTVDYELNRNDYTKKLDGTDSDIANTSYGGNAMVGIPKVYWKIVDNGDNTANIYICDKKIDSDFHCWSHIDNNGNEIDYCYLSAYDGCNINSTLRSISGQSPMTNQTGTTEINYAKSNNIGSDIIWYTGLFNDWMLINILLFLIGKSTNSQITFGAGNNNTYVSTSNTGIKKSGTMNTKGLFWGSNDNASGVKVFGIENFYGNVWKRIGGWINNKGTQKIKMTYGQSDGSTVDGYNTDGNGYIAIGNSTFIGTSGGYISKVLFNENGLIPTTVNGSQTTYYCDGLWFNNSQINYALVGGNSSSDCHVGAFCPLLNSMASLASWGAVATLSCKPLATT